MLKFSMAEKLRKCDPTIRGYVRTLEKRNIDLQEKIGTLAAENFSLKSRITALKKGQLDPHELELTKEEKEKKLILALEESGYEVTKISS